MKRINKERISLSNMQFYEAKHIRCKTILHLHSTIILQIPKRHHKYWIDYFELHILTITLDLYDLALHTLGLTTKTKTKQKSTLI